MSIPAPNPQTFDWIKGALDGSMTTVMSEVTQAEKESNYARLTTVPGNLHQIYGSLKMVELDAAGMLAEDLEKLCMLICDSIETEPSEQHKNIKLLRRGLESLQGYIDSVSRQTPVSPLSLVDQINQVREVTGGKQVSRFDLFDPPLGRLSFDNQDNEAPIPAPARSRAVPDDIRVRLVTQLRRKYRRALLSWLAIRNKNDGSEEYLEKINDLLQHLFRISSLDISQQLWWVASGFVDAVASGDLGPDKRIKSQFARLDIEISRLEQDSTAGIATNPPDELLRQMLFFLGPLKDPESDRIRQIQKALDLPQWFGTDSEDYEQLVKLSRSLNQIRENFDSHKFDQIESLMSEFFAGSTDTPGNAGSDALDSALNELLERAEQAELEPMFKLVRQIKDTATTTEKTADALSLTAADIKIASALLFVRDSIANAESLDATWEHSVNSYLEELQALSAQTEKSKDRAVQIRKVAEVEYHHARSAASSQIKEALSQIEDALAQFESDENEIDPAQLQFATDQLHQIANLFSIVDHSSAAKLSQKVAKSLALVLNNELHLNQPIIEQLAFAVAAIGAGADYLAKRGPDARKVLQKALKYLDKAVKRELARKDDQEGAGSQQQKTFVTSIAKIDLYRQQLAVGDTSSVGELIDVFSTLESGLGLEQGKTISDLSKLGRELCLFLTDVEKSLNSDHEDFIGLLARQLKELSVSKCDVDLEAWQERFDSLMTVNAGKSLAEQSDTSLGGSADRESGTGFDSSSSFKANNNSAEGERVSDTVEQSSIVDLQAELAAVSASLKDIDFADEYSQPPDDAIELDAAASASISEVEKIGNEFSLFEKKEESEIVSTDDSDDTELNLPEESLQALEEGLTQQNQVEVSKGGDFDLLDERNEFSETDFPLPNEVEELSEADFKLLDEQHEAGADASEPDEVETLSEADFKLHVEREPESETESIKLSEAEDIAEADFKSLEGQEQEEEPDSAMLVQLDQDLKSIFVNEFAAHLERLEQDIAKISDRAHKSEVPLNNIISDIEECIHTLSGNCRNLGFDEAAECAESGVKRLRQEFGTEFESESVSHFREGILLLRQALDQISDKGNYDKDLGGRFLASHYSSEQALERSDTTSAPNGSSTIIDESLNELDTQQGIDSVAVESSNKESSRQESTWDTGQPSSTIADFSEQESAEVPVSVSEAGAGDAEIDEEIRQIFLEETEGILERINNHLIE
ncbi:MAG: Hpt domain-containing protein, partial [Arenicellales bacterium]